MSSTSLERRLLQSAQELVNSVTSSATQRQRALSLWQELLQEWRKLVMNGTFLSSSSTPTRSSMTLSAHGKLSWIKVSSWYVISEHWVTFVSKERDLFWRKVIDPTSHSDSAVIRFKQVAKEAHHLIEAVFYSHSDEMMIAEATEWRSLWRLWLHSTYEWMTLIPVSFKQMTYVTLFASTAFHTASAAVSSRAKRDCKWLPTNVYLSWLNAALSCIIGYKVDLAKDEKSTMTPSSSYPVASADATRLLQRLLLPTINLQWEPFTERILSLLYGCIKSSPTASVTGSLLLCIDILLTGLYDLNRCLSISWRHAFMPLVLSWTSSFRRSSPLLKRIYFGFLGIWSSSASHIWMMDGRMKRSETRELLQDLLKRVWDGYEWEKNNGTNRNVPFLVLLQRCETTPWMISAAAILYRCQVWRVSLDQNDDENHDPMNGIEPVTKRTRRSDVLQDLIDNLIPSNESNKDGNLMERFWQLMITFLYYYGHLPSSHANQVSQWMSQFYFDRLQPFPNLLSFYLQAWTLVLKYQFSCFQEETLQSLLDAVHEMIKHGPRECYSSAKLLLEELIPKLNRVVPFSSLILSNDCAVAIRNVSISMKLEAMQILMEKSSVTASEMASFMLGLCGIQQNFNTNEHFVSQGPFYDYLMVRMKLIQMSEKRLGVSDSLIYDSKCSDSVVIVCKESIHSLVQWMEQRLIQMTESCRQWRFIQCLIYFLLNCPDSILNTLRGSTLIATMRQTLTHCLLTLEEDVLMDCCDLYQIKTKSCLLDYFYVKVSEKDDYYQEDCQYVKILNTLLGDDVLSALCNKAMERWEFSSKRHLSTSQITRPTVLDDDFNETTQIMTSLNEERDILTEDLSWKETSQNYLLPLLVLLTCRNDSSIIERLFDLVPLDPLMIVSLAYYGSLIDCTSRPWLQLWEQAMLKDAIQSRNVWMHCAIAKSIYFWLFQYKSFMKECENQETLSQWQHWFECFDRFRREKKMNVYLTQLWKECLLERSSIRQMLSMDEKSEDCFHGKPVENLNDLIELIWNTFQSTPTNLDSANCLLFQCIHSISQYVCPMKSSLNCSILYRLLVNCLCFSCHNLSIELHFSSSLDWIHSVLNDFIFEWMNRSLPMKEFPFYLWNMNTFEDFYRNHYQMIVCACVVVKGRKMEEVLHEWSSLTPVPVSVMMEKCRLRSMPFYLVIDQWNQIHEETFNLNAFRSIAFDFSDSSKLPLLLFRVLTLWDEGNTSKSFGIRKFPDLFIKRTLSFLVTKYSISITQLFQLLVQCLPPIEASLYYCHLNEKRLKFLLTWLPHKNHPLLCQRWITSLMYFYEKSMSSDIAVELIRGIDFIKKMNEKWSLRCLNRLALYMKGEVEFKEMVSRVKEHETELSCNSLSLHSILCMLESFLFDRNPLLVKQTMEALSLCLSSDLGKLIESDFNYFTEWRTNSSKELETLPNAIWDFDFSSKGFSTCAKWLFHLSNCLFSSISSKETQRFFMPLLPLCHEKDAAMTILNGFMHSIREDETVRRPLLCAMNKVFSSFDREMSWSLSILLKWHLQLNGWKYCNESELLSVALVAKHCQQWEMALFHMEGVLRTQTWMIEAMNHLETSPLERKEAAPVFTKDLQAIYQGLESIEFQSIISIKKPDFKDLGSWMIQQGQWDKALSIVAIHGAKNNPTLPWIMSMSGLEDFIPKEAQTFELAWQHSQWDLPDAPPAEADLSVTDTFKSFYFAMKHFVHQNYTQCENLIQNNHILFDKLRMALNLVKSTANPLTSQSKLVLREAQQKFIHFCQENTPLERNAFYAHLNCHAILSEKCLSAEQRQALLLGDCALAREQGYFPLAMKLLKQLEGKDWKVLLEKAQLFHDMGQGSFAISLGKCILSEMNETLLHCSNDDSSLLRASVLYCLGKWHLETLASHLDFSSCQELIETYLLESLNLTNSLEMQSQIYTSLAQFADQRWTLLEEDQVQRETVLNAQQFHANHSLAQLIQKEMNQQEQEREHWLLFAMENYLKGLTVSEDSKLVFRMCSLWLSHMEREKVQQLMTVGLPRVESRKVLILMYQLAARLTLDKQSPLWQLMKRLVKEHPFHSVYQLIALKNGGSASSASEEASNPLTKLLSMTAGELLQESMTLVPSLKECLLLADIYRHLARLKQDKSVNPGIVSFPATHFKKWNRCLPLAAVLTHPPAVDRLCQYRDFVSVRGFEQSYRLLQGINRPKLLYCLGSDGRSYAQLVKDKDDLRKDAIISQFFSHVDHLFRQSHIKMKSSNNFLSICTFRIIPLDHQSGVLEWVARTTTLGDWLIDAHKRLRPQDKTHSECKSFMMKLFTDALTGKPMMHASSSKEKKQALLALLPRFQPVMRHFFLESFSSPALWLQQRLSFTKSLAATSMLCHVVGLGDRHPFNILLSLQTSQVIHIDLNMTFEAGKSLPIPECVPFRLTRDLVDALGVQGIEGPFQVGCEQALTVMHSSRDALLLLLQVLKYDPLYKWSLPHEADRVLIKVKEKLTLGGECTGDSVKQNVQQQVRHWISEAASLERLSRMYPGWAAWL